MEDFGFTVILLEVDARKVGRLSVRCWFPQCEFIPCLSVEEHLSFEIVLLFYRYGQLISRSELLADENIWIFGRMFIFYSAKLMSGPCPRSAAMKGWKMKLGEKSNGPLRDGVICQKKC